MRREGGFSMIEILVSMVIFSMGVLSLGHVFIIGVNTIHKTKFQVKATSLAREMIEEIKSKAYDEVMVGDLSFEERNRSEFTNYSSPGNPESGYPTDTDEDPNDRTTFDDIDDFANYSEESIEGAEGFNRSVKVVYAKEDNLNGSANSTQTYYKRIIVKVKSKTFGQVVKLSSVIYYRVV